MLPQAPFRRPEAKKAGEDIRAREMTSPTVDPVSRRPPTNRRAAVAYSATHPPSVVLVELFLFERSSYLNAARSVVRSERRHNAPQVACPHPTSVMLRATGARMDIRTMRRRAFVTPPTGRRTDLDDADKHDALRGLRNARRRRVARSTSLSEPGVILRS